MRFDRPDFQLHFPLFDRLHVQPLIALLLLALLAACAGIQPEATTDEGPAEEPVAEVADTPVPVSTAAPTPTVTPTSDYRDMLSLPSFAAGTPGETFEAYLSESIAQQASLQREKLDMRIRYQNPSALLLDLGGLILNIELVEDRTRRTAVLENSATFEVDIDVRVTFADGDTSTQTCAWTTSLQRVGEIWYVVNPAPLTLTNCA